MANFNYGDYPRHPGQFIDELTERIDNKSAEAEQRLINNANVAAEAQGDMSAQDVRMACVGLVCRQMRKDPETVDWIVDAADTLANFVLNGKAKAEG